MPPKDVNTILGAELWALKQALTFVPSPCAIYVDCKTVVDGVRRGHHWIYSSKRRYHQHWVSLSGLGCGRVCWKTQDVVRSVVARQLQAQELAVFVGQVTALANAWPGDDGGIRRDSTGKPQGVLQEETTRCQCCWRWSECWWWCCAR